MGALLEAVAREREELTAWYEARLAMLDEMRALAERLAEPLPGMHVAKPAISPASAKPRATLPPPQPRHRPRPRVIGNATNRAMDVAALIGELEPVAARDLLARVPYSRDTLYNVLGQLRDAGVVRSTGSSHKACWHLTATLDREVAESNGKAHRAPHSIRADVLQTIRSEPDRWTEQRMAETGAFDREDVAVTCGALLAAGDIILNPDGTYRPALAAVA